MFAKFKKPQGAANGEQPVGEQPAGEEPPKEEPVKEGEDKPAF